MRQKTKTTSKTRIVKLTDANDGLAIYIDPAQVAALKEVRRQYRDPNNPPMNSYPSYDLPHPDAQCMIYMACGRSFNIIEHIAVVSAIFKGEDPSPAEVIFGTE